MGTLHQSIKEPPFVALPVPRRVDHSVEQMTRQLWRQDRGMERAGRVLRDER